MSATQTPHDDGDKAVPPGGNAYVNERAQLKGDANQVAEKFAHYPVEARDDALWLHFFVRQKCNSEFAVLAKIAQSLGLKDKSGKEPSNQYWYQVSGGHYFKTGGDVAAFKRYVAAFRAYARTREERGSIPFIETKNWHLVNDYINSRRSWSSSYRFGAIVGETGAQKTHCTSHYTVLNNHLETIRFEAPSRATRPRVVMKMAASYLVPDSRSNGEKELAIERFLRGEESLIGSPSASDRPRCVIVENVQRLLRPNVQPDQQPVFNYFHELQDDTGACFIFTLVPTFLDTLKSTASFWRQFMRRIGGDDEVLFLDQRLQRGDILKFAREFKVADDQGAYPILKRWATTPWGVGVFTGRLEKARRIADARKSDEVTIEHLQQVELEPASPAPAKEEAA